MSYLTCWFEYSDRPSLTWSGVRRKHVYYIGYFQNHISVQMFTFFLFFSCCKCWTDTRKRGGFLIHSCNKQLPCQVPGIILQSAVFRNVLQELKWSYIIFVCLPSFDLFITLVLNLFGETMEFPQIKNTSHKLNQHYTSSKIISWWHGLTITKYIYGITVYKYSFKVL